MPPHPIAVFRVLKTAFRLWQAVPPEPEGEAAAE
jgi:hypothetical protein